MYWASHRMLSTYFTIYITSPLSFCRIRFIQYSGSIKKFKYPLSYPSELFASIRLHTKQPVLQNTEHQSQIHPHQHRSLYILSPKMKTMETGQYQPQSRTQDNPHYSQCISHTSIHLELSGSVLGWQQLIVSVMSLAGTGSTQLQLNRSLSQPEHNHRIHTAAAASLTVTAWTQSQDPHSCSCIAHCHSLNTITVLHYCRSTGHIPGWGKRRCYFRLSLINHLLHPVTSSAIYEALVIWWGQLLVQGLVQV